MKCACRSQKAEETATLTMVKIAVVQFHIRQTIGEEDVDVDANLKKAEEFIAKAKQSDVDIVIFPE